jgi:hypothetical protein
MLQEWRRLVISLYTCTLYIDWLMCNLNFSSISATMYILVLHMYIKFPINKSFKVVHKITDQNYKQLIKFEFYLNTFSFMELCLVNQII